MADNFSLKEITELHELITLQINQSAKLMTTASHVEDEEFKTFIKNYTNLKKGHIEALKNFIQTQQQQ